MKQDIFQENEINANKQMIKASIFSGFILLVIWLLYLLKFIPLKSYALVYIFFPINILLLFSTFFLQKTSFFYKKQFKYFLLLLQLIVYSIINVVVPKHGILLWALVLILTNHYYQPKFGKIIFIIALIMMFSSLYFGMIFGEYDSNLLGKGVIRYNDALEPYIYQPQRVKERIQMLEELLAEGENRYLKVFLYYYLPRAVSLVIIFFTSNALNIRTFELLEKETKINDEKKQIEAELNIAKDIQLAALPKELVNTKDVEMLAELISTKEVGGDLYDYFILDDDHIVIIIGDVSGKGIPAAMFMMKTITCFKAYTKLGKTPSEILKEVNRDLFEGNESGMFVTCFLGILNTKNGMFTYANAGHNRPIIGSNNKFRYLDCKSGFILGVMEDAMIFDETTYINKGESIILYTDGITEARNIDGEFYGDNRLIKFCNSKEFTSLLELQYDLKDDIHSFVGNANQSDDMTYLFLKYQGDPLYIDEIKRVTTRNNYSEFLEFLNKNLEKCQVKYLYQKLAIVIDEIYSNIFYYAYPEGSGDVYLRFMFNKKTKEVILTFIDKGVFFNPLDKDNKEVEQDSSLGGLGIMMVKQNVDSMAYNRLNDKNILTLKVKG